MARAKAFHSILALNLTLLDRALLAYYARKLGTDQAKIVRAMVREYMRHDSNFDPSEFKKFVDSEVLSDLSREEAAQLKLRTKAFLAECSPRTARR